jgi:hypothetical protein
MFPRRGAACCVAVGRGMASASEREGAGDRRGVALHGWGAASCVAAVGRGGMWRRPARKEAVGRHGERCVTEYGI